MYVFKLINKKELTQPRILLSLFFFIEGENNVILKNVTLCNAERKNTGVILSSFLTH